MSNDIYSPPAANLDMEIADLKNNGAIDEYYVVSKRKFYILFFATLGTYIVYWFFENWRRYKIRTNDSSIWPVPRSIFSIFFAHALFESVDRALARNDKQHDWEPRSLATTFVLMSIAANLLDRLSSNHVGSPYTDILSILALPFLGAVVYQAQIAINKSCGDPSGTSNDRLTVANYLWIVFGVLIWAGIAYRLFRLFAGTAH